MGDGKIGIKILVGGIGQGKSVTAAKWVTNSKSHVFGNFSIKYDKYSRIKLGDIMLKKDGKAGVNWNFWQDNLKRLDGFDIVLDEIHNIMNSRRAMSTNNVVIGKWISQIRKLTGESQNHDLLVVSQRLAGIDTIIRGLASTVVRCSKVINHRNKIETVVREHGRLKKKVLSEVWIFLEYFMGDGCVDRAMSYSLTFDKKLRNMRYHFLANPYFKFYDSYEIISFGEDEYL